MGVCAAAAPGGLTGLPQSAGSNQGLLDVLLPPFLHRLSEEKGCALLILISPTQLLSRVRVDSGPVPRPFCLAEPAVSP